MICVSYNSRTFFSLKCQNLRCFVLTEVLLTWCSIHFHFERLKRISLFNSCLCKKPKYEGEPK